jgi:cytochrome P450
MSPRFEFSPLSPEFHEDPYPIYARLRVDEPVHRNAMGNWLLTRYDDITAVLRDSRFGVHSMSANLRSKRRFLAPDQDLDTLADTVGQWLMFLNPPEHTRMRRLVSRPLTPAAVKVLHSRVEQTTATLLEPARRAGRMDIVNDLAVPLAVSTISDILGVPIEDQRRVLVWTESLSHIVDPLRSLEEYLAMNQVAGEFMDYFRALFSERRRAPKDDLISALVADSTGEQATETELLSMCTNLFAAGQKTTVNFIGNGMLALLRHPDQLALLRERPEIVSSAMDELLRYDSPVQLITRLSREEVSLRGRTIPAGSLVFLALGSANRDPDQFPDPDRLDLTRKDNRHIAFAPGTHFCLGAMLAHLEGQIAIGAIARSFVDIKLASDAVELQSEIIFRGPQTLPVTFSPTLLKTHDDP